MTMYKNDVYSRYLAAFTAALLCLFALPSSYAEDSAEVVAPYLLQPGDVMQVSVWKEDGLDKQLVIRPDGRISFPLAGELMAAGDSVAALTREITDKLTKYIPDPVVTVSVAQLAGNRIYIIGKVNRPGVFPISRNVDVMQALSIAGGTGTYASLNNIKILRRVNGELTAIPFRYGDVEDGENLQQSIILQAGDVVVVP